LYRRRNFSRTVRIATVSTGNNTYKFDNNVDVTNEYHVVDDEVNDIVVEDDDSDRD
jgi:hypothetical protein